MRPSLRASFHCVAEDMEQLQLAINAALQMKPTASCYSRLLASLTSSQLQVLFEVPCVCVCVCVLTEGFHAVWIIFTTFTHPHTHPHTVRCRRCVYT